MVTTKKSVRIYKAISREVSKGNESRQMEGRLATLLLSLASSCFSSEPAPVTEMHHSARRLKSHIFSLKPGKGNLDCWEVLGSHKKDKVWRNGLQKDLHGVPHPSLSCANVCLTSDRIPEALRDDVTSRSSLRPQTHMGGSKQFSKHLKTELIEDY